MIKKIGRLDDAIASSDAKRAQRETELDLAMKRFRELEQSLSERAAAEEAAVEGDNSAREAQARFMKESVDHLKKQHEILREDMASKLAMHLSESKLMVEASYSSVNVRTTDLESRLTAMVGSAGSLDISKLQPMIEVGSACLSYGSQIIACSQSPLHNHPPLLPPPSVAPPGSSPPNTTTTTLTPAS